jgi:malate dehydrogenase
MREVAILGAGELGGAVAHVLARRDIVGSIRLVDEAGSVAAGKALDIAQAAPIEGFATQLRGATDIASAAGASVIVVADRVGAGEWRGDEGAQLLKRLARMAPRAVLLCAAAAQRETIDRAVRELRLDRAHVFGSAPEAFASGARALCALAANGSPQDVALSLVGNPPDHTVFLWEQATIGGVALTSLLSEPERRRLAGRITASWPPGAYTLACAAVAAIEAMSGRTRRTLTCFVGPDTAMGAKTRTGALPVRLGAAGIERVMLPDLSARERVALQSALEL